MKIQCIEKKLVVHSAKHLTIFWVCTTKRSQRKGLKLKRPVPKGSERVRAAPKSNGANGKAQDAGSFSSLGNIVYFGNTTHVSSYACNDHMMYIVIPD